MKLKHIEVKGCVVNIRTGLIDMRGREVTSVEIIPDHDYEGFWKVIPHVHNVRVIKLKKSV